ncbi:lipase family protein [Bacillus songklensis]|uniref:Lipase family protein n=1 Tax=Bacillus songklensis TaxID=1069116 RepID=A0ABV8B473_9BACI
MVRQSIIPEETALFLAQCCQLTYEQQEQNRSFSIPWPFQLVKPFKAHSFGMEEWFGFILESSLAIVVAFRGTKSDVDWISDLRYSQVPYQYVKNAGNVHSGFMGVYESCRDELIGTLKGLSPLKPIFMTGHSLGAALATLHAFDASINLDDRIIIMVNFASPRVGDPTFVYQYKQYIPYSLRYVNFVDLIPFLPPRKIYSPIKKSYSIYRHIPNNITFYSNQQSIEANHSIQTYINFLANKRLFA